MDLRVLRYRTAVVILQHGEKTGERGDPGLTGRGRRQAEQAAAALAPLTPAAVVSSPLLRARQTAEPLARACGLPLQTDARIRERMNLQPGQDPARFVAEWRTSTQDREWQPTAGRSSLATAADMLAALDRHAVRDRAVVLVGHGGATVDLLRTLLGDTGLETYSPGLIASGVPAGAITVLTRSGDAWATVEIASVSHLPRADQSGHATG